MEIRILEKKDYKAWDSFCSESDDAWFWHTIQHQEAILAHGHDKGIERFSFAILHNGRIVAVCPLFFIVSEHGREFGGNNYGVAPALANVLTLTEREKMLTLIFDEVDRKAKEKGVQRMCMRFPFFNNIAVARAPYWNYLTKYGFIDTSTNTQLLDLGLTLEELRKDVRHGHNSDITRGSKELSFIICDKEKCPDDMYEMYVALHERVHDFKDNERSEYFKVMREILSEGNAFLAGASLNGQIVGFAYFIIYKGNVYYASSCKENDLKFRTIPISHFIQWESIKYMKSKGYRWYEMGWQYNTSTFIDSDKGVSISHFKRGFGGCIAPLFRGEKYYDKDFFKYVFNERIEKYYETQFSKK